MVRGVNILLSVIATTYEGVLNAMRFGISSSPVAAAGVLSLKLSCISCGFVSGHGFSRADAATQKNMAFRPSGQNRKPPLSS